MHWLLCDFDTYYMPQKIQCLIYGRICVCGHCPHEIKLCTGYYAVLIHIICHRRSNALYAAAYACAVTVRMKLSYALVIMQFWHILYATEDPMPLVATKGRKSFLLLMESKDSIPGHGVPHLAMKPLHHFSFFCQTWRLFLYIIIFNI
jgi:hypothetical protein